MLVATEQAVRPGAMLQIYLQWPWLLDGSTPIQLVASVRVVRRFDSGFAAVMLRHQFRTVRRESTEPVRHLKAKAAGMMKGSAVFET